MAKRNGKAAAAPALAIGENGTHRGEPAGEGEGGTTAEIVIELPEPPPPGDWGLADPGRADLRKVTEDVFALMDAVEWIDEADFADLALMGIDLLRWFVEADAEDLRDHQALRQSGAALRRTLIGEVQPALERCVRIARPRPRDSGYSIGTHYAENAVLALVSALEGLRNAYDECPGGDLLVGTVHHDPRSRVVSSVEWAAGPPCSISGRRETFIKAAGLDDFHDWPRLRTDVRIDLGLAAMPKKEGDCEASEKVEPLGLTFKQVEALTTMSESKIRNMMKAGQFPKPMKLGKGKTAKVLFDKSTVLAWWNKRNRQGAR